MKRAPIPILMYHQVDVPPPSGTPMRGLVVAPGAFARQMALLKALGYCGLAMRDLWPYLTGEKQGKVVGITFDDGYLNNLQHAAPVLQRQGFTATCYAVSGAFGGTNDWDAAAGVPQKRLMALDDWRAWLACGMEVGAHSRHHVDLTQIDPERAQAEIGGCRKDLEQALHTEVRHFCYPYGRYTEAQRQMVEEAGYLSATTVRRGRVQAGEESFALPRVLVAQSTHLLHFWLKLATRYEDKRG